MRWALGALLVLVVLLAIWLIMRARSVDRLHHQVIQAEHRLERNLARRREILQTALAPIGLMDEDAQRDLKALLDSAAPATTGHSYRTESDITHWIREVFMPKFAASNAPLHGVGKELESNGFEIQASKRFYNQQVAQTFRLRTKPDVTLFHLAGKAAMPTTRDFCDDL